MFTTVNQANTQSPAKVQFLSMPNVLLRLEGLAVFLAASVLFAHLGGSLVLFLALILLPDLSAVGYLHGIRLGSITYNAAHTYLVPLLMGAVAIGFNIPVLLLLATVWTAHIGIDRIAGYGFKYPTEFKDTHMQHV